MLDIHCFRLYLLHNYRLLHYKPQFVLDLRLRLHHYNRFHIDAGKVERFYCEKNNIKQRTCKDNNKCKTAKDKPEEVGSCEYQGTCSDEIMNGNEEGIDCGQDIPL